MFVHAQPFPTRLFELTLSLFVAGFRNREGSPILSAESRAGEYHKHFTSAFVLNTDTQDRLPYFDLVCSVRKFPYHSHSYRAPRLLGSFHIRPEYRLFQRGCTYFRYVFE